MAKIEWAKARRDYEKQGMSLAAIARKHGVSVTSVQGHKKSEGWNREQIVDDLPAETVASSFAPEQTIPVEAAPGLRVQQRIAQLEAELAEARRRVVAQEAELEKHRPTVEWHVYTTPEQVRQFFGEEKMKEIAGLALAEQNKARVKRGLPPFDYEHNPEMHEREIVRIVDELLARRTRFIDANQRL